MSSKRITIDDVELAVWEKSFKVAPCGPVHFIGDDLETTMRKIVTLVLLIRSQQHEQDVKALEKVKP